MSNLTFSAADALKTTSALRDALGLPPEQFPVQAFVGMISDEIEQLRAKGKTDSEIAELVSRATGKRMSANLIDDHYAAAEDRGKGR